MVRTSKGNGQAMCFKCKVLKEFVDGTFTVDGDWLCQECAEGRII